MMLHSVIKSLKKEQQEKKKKRRKKNYKKDRVDPVNLVSGQLKEKWADYIQIYTDVKSLNNGKAAIGISIPQLQIHH